MGRNFGVLFLCLALMLLFVSENQASSVVEFSASAGLSGSGLGNDDQILYGTTQGTLHPQECGSRCNSRCSATSFKKPCMFFCQKCCAACLCVPPGTYGNKQVCPCYNNWKTKRGGPKCP